MTNNIVSTSAKIQSTSDIKILILFPRLKKKKLSTNPALGLTKKNKQLPSFFV